ncbi:nitrogen regulation protein NR(II) [Thermodesulfobacteriota bacterium]
MIITRLKKPGIRNPDLIETFIRQASIALQRKSAEKALQLSEDQLKILLQNIQTAVVVHGADTKILRCNREAEELLGLSVDQMLGKKTSDPAWNFLLENGSIMSVEEYPVNQVLNSRKPLKNFIGGIDRPDKQDIIWVWGNAVPVFNHEEKVSEIITTFMDITERKKAEEERTRFQARLFQTQKMETITTLAGGVAHQFNNALSIIFSNLDLLEMLSEEKESIPNYTDRIKDSADRMRQLTNQLVAYAREGKYYAKEIPLSYFVKDTLPLLIHDIKSSITIETDLPQDIQNIKADSVQMQMVLSAILSNASESIEDIGNITISCSDEEITVAIAKRYPGVKPGAYVKLSIIDDGMGMDEATRTRVFEPFFTTKFQGRGLGMAAVYGIVKNHSGWIVVDSELGKGTSVSIYLPAV